MNVRLFTLTIAMAAALTLPAIAQQGPSTPNWGYVPSRADVQNAKAAENLAVRSAAQKVYAELVADQLNRSKLTQDVDAAFSDSTEKVLSQRLTELGPAAWTFVKNAQTSAGTVAIYQLKFATSSAYITFGAGDDGVVYALGLSKNEP